MFSWEDCHQSKLAFKLKLNWQQEGGHETQLPLPSSQKLFCPIFKCLITLFPFGVMFETERSEDEKEEEVRELCGRRKFKTRRLGRAVCNLFSHSTSSPFLSFLECLLFLAHSLWLFSYLPISFLAFDSLFIPPFSLCRNFSFLLYFLIWLLHLPFSSSILFLPQFLCLLHFLLPFNRFHNIFLWIFFFISSISFSSFFYSTRF